MRKRWIAALMAAALVMAMAGTAMAADAEESDSTELNEVQMLRASALAGYFAPAEEGEDPSDEDVEALTETIVSLRHGEDRSVGWGVLYKLLLLSEFSEMGLSEYVESFDGGWGLGKLMKEARDEDPEWTGDKPKNLGQWKKQQRESDG